jgi:hypothetical protein
MDSLPEQHIDSLPKDRREKAYKQVAWLWAARMQGISSKKELANKADFPSVEAMCVNLQHWGLAGMLPETSRPTRKPKVPKFESETQELPPFANAAAHLRDTLRTLESPYLEHMLTLKETLQGRYFVGKGETDEPNISEVRGAQWHPHPYEVVLIAVSILERQGNWWHVERLLNELHPRPAEANRQKLVRYIYGRAVDVNGRPKRDTDGRWKDEKDGLLHRAKQIATLIRGVHEVAPGPKPTDITSYDQWEAELLRPLIQQGLSDEEIEETVREGFERSKLETEQSVLEELELARQTLGEDEFARESSEAHRYLRELSEQPFDRDGFYRRLKFARDYE